MKNVGKHFSMATSNSGSRQPLQSSYMSSMHKCTPAHATPYLCVLWYLHPYFVFLWIYTSTALQHKPLLTPTFHQPHENTPSSSQNITSFLSNPHTYSHTTLHVLPPPPLNPPTPSPYHPPIPLSTPSSRTLAVTRMLRPRL